MVVVVALKMMILQILLVSGSELAPGAEPDVANGEQMGSPIFVSREGSATVRAQESAAFLGRS